jgi:hypothetical protein
MNRGNQAMADASGPITARNPTVGKRFRPSCAPPAPLRSPSYQFPLDKCYENGHKSGQNR